ncbi:MAG TPA: ABC transporter permease [Candidatus Limnocylindrales bacterium]|jgi:uncharacterized membrane protein YdcZ (DUF606 family)|nr:ABC transporter permease [Candidatus Limnocylindrales bacterium]
MHVDGTRVLLFQCRLALRLASVLVPRVQRADWYNEWYGEVWHWVHFLAETGRLSDPESSARERLKLARHLQGAFADAAWLRFDRNHVLDLVSETPRSPAFCLSMIGVVLLLAIVLTGFAPTLRSGFSTLPYDHPRQLAELSFRRSFARYHESTLFYAVRRWHSDTVQNITAYSWHPVDAVVDGRRVPTIAAGVSPNFFALLGSHAALGRTFGPEEQQQCERCVVVSHQFWTSQLGGSTRAIGGNIRISGKSYSIIGILPDTFTFLYPDVSLWTLPGNDTNFSERTGAILRLAPGASLADASAELSGRIKGDPSSFGYGSPLVSALESRASQSTRMYLLFTLISLIGGFSLSGGRLAAVSTTRLHLSRNDRLRWWAFFAGKTLLLVVTCFVVALELSGRISVAFTGGIHPIVGPASTWLFLVTAMVALSWSIHDQSRRCRICLRRLSHEASVGVPGYSLLDYWGSELVCSDGHGLLYIPELKASWQQFDRWIQLDPSWKPMFEEEAARVS